MTAWPTRGLAYTDFRQVAKNGFGDQHNAYPHSMELFDGKLYVGTSRSNMCMLRVSKMKTRIRHWPVECPDDLYDLDMRAQIHALDLGSGRWREVSRSPFIEGNPDPRIPREMSYRCMVVFQGESDATPALYCGTYARRGPHAARPGAGHGPPVHLAGRCGRRQPQRGVSGRDLRNPGPGAPALGGGQRARLR